MRGSGFSAKLEDTTRCFAIGRSAWGAWYSSSRSSFSRRLSFSALGIATSSLRRSLPSSPPRSPSD